MSKKVEKNVILTTPLIPDDIAKKMLEKFSNMPLKIRKKKNKKPLKITPKEDKD